MKPLSLFSIILLFTGCGKNTPSLPVLTGGSANSQVAEISAQNYEARLEQLSQIQVDESGLQNHPEYQLDVLTMSFSLEASAGLGILEGGAHSQLDLHFKVLR
jgi:hypothetical protein